VQLTGPPWSEGRVLAAAEELFSATASARAGFVSSR
jgi:Asp-tRNA(Asn)/Glu-tRNA(Gln) amidotransferase A subunit family amidase